MKNRQEILARLCSLTEYQTVRQISELDSINKVHSLNFNQLKQHLENLPNLKASTQGNLFNVSIYAKIEKVKYEFELLQLLNNYLSSAFSVVDYTRKHFEKHYNNSLLPEYSKKVLTDFSENPFHRFMQDFRNYAIHYGIPKLSTTKQIKPSDNDWITEHYITLNLKDLYDSSYDWKGLSKYYLEKRISDEIKLLPLFDEYFNHLDGFQKWYKQKQREIFDKEISIIENAERDFSLLMFEDLMKYINSGKGYNYEMVENMLLHCFTYECQREILSIQDTDERLHLILSKLKSKISVPTADILILQLTLTINKDNIKAL
jgi:hypothetical protein